MSPPGTRPSRAIIVVTGVITCSANFSLLEARRQLRWEAATSASTASVCVQSRLRRLGGRAEGCRTQDGRTKKKAEMLLRKGRPQGPQACPQVRPAPTILLVGLHRWDWTWGAGRVGRGAGLLREGGGQGGSQAQSYPQAREESSQDYQTPINEGGRGWSPSDRILSEEASGQDE